MTYNQLPSHDRIEKAAAALTEHGIQVDIVASGDEAKKKVFELLPQGAQVMTMTSVTLDTLGIPQEIMDSGKYNPVRTVLNDPTAPADIKRQLGAAADWVIGSVHAVTEDGSLMIASNTGSQLPGYAYGGGHVIWVVGAQKLVSSIDEGFKRIYDYVLPLESERAHKAYGVPGSFVSKLLIINKEVQKDRCHIILINEAFGF